MVEARRVKQGDRVVIGRTIAELQLKNGIMYACEQQKIPYVLAGSIRDDGPLPEVITDVARHPQGI